MRVPGIQFSLFSSSSSPFPILDGLDAELEDDDDVRTLDNGLRVLLPLLMIFDSRRPSEDTVRDSFRRFSCTEPGTGTGIGEFWLWFARIFCLEEREDRWLRDRNRLGGVVPSADAAGDLQEELDKALLASVSKVDCQTRGSRERPKGRSLSATAAVVAARGVTGRMALWLLRRLRLL